MQHLKSYLALLLVAMLYGCATRPNPYTSEVNFVRRDEEGTLVLKSLGLGSTKLEAVQMAETAALKVLLFKGLPGSELANPLVENEAEAQNGNRRYFSILIDHGRYKTFIMNSTPYFDDYVLGKNWRVNVNIKWNISSLRKDLEQNGIIRKFGY